MISMKPLRLNGAGHWDPRAVEGPIPYVMFGKLEWKASERSLILGSLVLRSGICNSLLNVPPTMSGTCLSVVVKAL